MVSDIEHEQVYYFNQTYKGKNYNTINATKLSLHIHSPTIQLVPSRWLVGPRELCRGVGLSSFCLVQLIARSCVFERRSPSNLGIVLSMSKLSLHSRLASELGIFCLQSSDRFLLSFLHFLIQSLLFAFRDRCRWCSVEFDQCILKDWLDVHHIWQTLLIFRGVLIHTTVTN